MQTPPIPHDEAERIIALRTANILDTPPEETFDRITRLVSSILNVPIALVSLVDSDRQWFKSQVGLGATETTRNVSFCAHAILSPEVFVIKDVLTDTRFADNPLVTGNPHIRFYAGVPLYSVEGHALGTLCSIDHVPREFSSDQIAILKDLAKIVEELLQQRQIAYAAKTLLQSLEEREERYRHLIEQSPDAFIIHNDGIISFVNRAALNLLNAECFEELIGRPVLSIVAPEYTNIVQERMARAMNEGQDNPLYELEWLRKNGSRVFVEVTSIPYLMGNKRGVQVIARDITERKQEKLELERLATNDILTGLPNRTLLMDRLRQGVSRWNRNRQRAVIAFFGLDHFKYINDTFGNGVGDQTLVEIAKKLRTLLRSSDTGARIGGDEFVLIMEEMPDDEAPAKILQRIFNQLSQPIWIGAQEISIRCSAGFSNYPDDGVDADALLNAAYAAMHRAKDMGRSNIQRYLTDMRLRTSERIMLENELRHAIGRNELMLCYQPKIEALSGKIIGAEALVRWKHPRLGFISPARFIPIAEESGLILPVGEWIIRTVCEQIEFWQGAGLGSVPVAINLSGRQFLQQDIADFIKNVVDSVGIDPTLLEFELTESMSMGNPERSILIMREMKALGVSLSIDDFGTGYSNLSHLKRFPVDKLKIDQSFIGDITTSAETLALVRAIIAMAHSLRLTVVAEGVETEEQLSLLISHQCDQVQGYLFSKPMFQQEYTAFILGAPDVSKRK